MTRNLLGQLGTEKMKADMDDTPTQPVLSSVQYEISIEQAQHIFKIIIEQYFVLIIINK
jgi:hypothetical protein